MELIKPKLLYAPLLNIRSVNEQNNFLPLLVDRSQGNLQWGL